MKLAIGVFLAAASLLVASGWLPWVKVHRIFLEPPPYVLNGMELAYAGKIVVAGGLLIALAAIGFVRGGSQITAALWVSGSAGVAAAGAILWFMFNEEILINASAVVSRGNPLRLLDLGMGLPVAIFGATIALCCTTLLLRERRRVRGFHEGGPTQYAP